MFIAMNRFKVIKGEEKAFERVWLSRDTHLQSVPGFIEFHLLRGPEAEDHTLYSSHSVWANQAAFTAWTQSEAFRAAHRSAGDNKPLYLGHPQFEGFEVLRRSGAHRVAPGPRRSSVPSLRGAQRRSNPGANSPIFEALTPGLLRFACNDGAESSE